MQKYEPLNEDMILNNYCNITGFDNHSLFNENYGHINEDLANESYNNSIGKIINNRYSSKSSTQNVTDLG